MGFSQSVTFVVTDTKLRSNEMSKDGYYGDFGGYAEEMEAEQFYEEQCTEQDAISYMTNSIDELVATFGYELINSYLQTFTPKEQ